MGEAEVWDLSRRKAERERGGAGLAHVSFPRRSGAPGPGPSQTGPW